MFKWIVSISLVLVVVLLIGACAVNENLASSTQSYSSSQFKSGQFFNEKPVESGGLMKTLAIFYRFFTEKKINTVPQQALPVNTLTREQLLALSNDQLHLIKLGHSSVLLKVYGEFWLLDPVFAERASPFSFLGPKRFHQPPISIAELPPIERVLISHNHYDHLDKSAVKQLIDKTKQFLVPLGVENDLIKWGVEPANIQTFDWWQELKTPNALLAFTPTRHFSGRALGDANSTLWGSWVIKTQQQSIYFSGDSGYFDGFKQIGQKYGPFDLTLIETGAYDKDWPEIHMTPAQSVQAHLDLQGRVMLPIHNGTFDLAFHAWYEPLEQAAAIAQEKNVELMTPVVGEVINLNKTADSQKWWQSFM
ncbi:MBL fold metallo-hydrolase [Catenovulum sp. 2E275]|uniref:MBL fold metallo-hydrolase n=1 Tax=Catenovulum sp. 2E275 TaxID=2980497 RepID=UPI0021CDFCF4|nr:MBL fold metallo-hydrolase [Catenovulum sp. 2E275]MCU4676887.1 MBL fold metallo-hydrolase [Catenovulum sp. 2E275]